MLKVVMINGPAVGGCNSRCCYKGVLKKGNMNPILLLEFYKSCLFQLFQVFYGGILTLHTFKIRYLHIGPKSYLPRSCNTF